MGVDPWVDSGTCPPPYFLGVEIEIVATRCQILRLKFTKFGFGWGSAPDPAAGAYSSPHIAGFKGTNF